MDNRGCDCGPWITSRLATWNAAGQCLRLGNDGWLNRERMLGDGAHDLRLSRRHSFGCCLRSINLIFVLEAGWRTVIVFDLV